MRRTWTFEVVSLENQIKEHLRNMYTRGKARQEAAASADETEEEYVEVSEPSNVIPSSHSQYDWFPRATTTSGTTSQTFEITATESSCEETLVHRSPFKRRSRHSSKNSSSSQHKILSNDREVHHSGGDGAVQHETQYERDIGLASSMKSFMDTISSTMKSMQSMMDTTVQAMKNQMNMFHIEQQKPFRRLEPKYKGDDNAPKELQVHVPSTVSTLNEDGKPDGQPMRIKSKSNSKIAEMKSQESEKRLKPSLSSYTDISEDSEGDDRSIRSAVSTHRLFKRNAKESAKLPAFTGQENWTVWFTRFETVAELCGWNNEEKLRQLLPRIEGSAADFTYGQLKSTTLKKYEVLVKELKNRYGEIESCKTYKTKFNHRRQLRHETPEDFAAELKRLYDKAHPSRDALTRQEDLVSHILAGLVDEQARIHVELNKDQHNIDEAVVHVVHYKEIIEYKRAWNCNENFSQNVTHGRVRAVQNVSPKKDYISRTDDTNLVRAKTGDRYEKMEKKTKENIEIQEQIIKQRDWDERLCFACHQHGHFIKECPRKKRKIGPKVELALNPKAQEFISRRRTEETRTEGTNGHLNRAGLTLQA